MAQPYMSQKDVPNYGAVPSFPATPLPVYYVTPLPAPPPRRRFGFFKTFIVAVALLELAWFSRHWFHWDWDRPGHRHVHISPDGHWDIDVDMAGLDHDAEGCAVWDHYDPDKGSHVTGEASTAVTHKLREKGDKFTFSIPTSSERYHFVSWGPIDKSSFEVVPVKSDKDQIVAEVEVLKDSRGTARVCALPSTGEGKTYGVGIYSPRPYPHKSEDWPAFKVIVYVPVSSDGSQRNLNAFETRLGQFEHIFPDLSKSINFSKLHTSAANVPMTFESVVANSVHVSNANSPITGKLTSATSLAVNNANGPIRGDLTLTQAGDLSVHNANSPIDIKVHLKSGDFHPRPDYHLSVDNANSPIDLTIAEQPIGSGFFLKGSNAISAIRVHLNAAYEGEFKLSDVMKTPSVEFVNHKDPSGKGRERYLQFTKRGATTEGRIDWGRPDDPDVEHAPGSVTLSTVAAPLELYFD